MVRAAAGSCALMLAVVLCGCGGMPTHNNDGVARYLAHKARSPDVDPLDVDDALTLVVLRTQADEIVPLAPSLTVPPAPLSTVPTVPSLPPVPLKGPSEALLPPVPTIGSQVPGQPVPPPLPEPATAVVPQAPLPRGALPAAKVLPATHAKQAPQVDTLPPPRAVEKSSTAQPSAKRLQVPDVFPGAGTPDIVLPPPHLTSKAKFEQVVESYFPPLPEPPSDPPLQSGPRGKAWTLAEMEEAALVHNPLIQQARAELEAATGVALQAGLYPNPVVGYQADRIGEEHTAGRQGAFVMQKVKLGQQLNLSREIAQADVQRAQVKVRQVESELRTQVRHGYFAVLYAQMSLRFTRGVTTLSDELYALAMKRLYAGQIAPSEVMQLRVLALQARGQQVQAHNRFVASWKQLANTLSQPHLPPGMLEGHMEMPPPAHDYAKALSHILVHHTEMQTVHSRIQKARAQAQLARAELRPDLDVKLGVAKDFANPPYGMVGQIEIGIPVPLWNRNQGKRREAEGLIAQANESERRVQNELTTKLIEVFERYDNARRLVHLYRVQLIPSQIQAYRGTVELYERLGKDATSYNDLIIAQKTLVENGTAYVSLLREQWQALVILTDLLQLPQLYEPNLLPPEAPGAVQESPLSSFLRR